MLGIGHGTQPDRPRTSGANTVIATVRRPVGCSKRRCTVLGSTKGTVHEYMSRLRVTARTAEPTAVSHTSTHIPEEDVTDAGQAIVNNSTQGRAVRRCPRDVDPKDIEARTGVKVDVPDSSISGSPSEDVIMATRSIYDILPAPLIAEGEDPRNVETKLGPKVEDDMCIDEVRI